MNDTNSSDEARRMSRDLARLGRPISAHRLEALFGGAHPSHGEIASLQALNQNDRAQIARLRSRLAWLDAIGSRLWLIVIVLVTVALGLTVLSRVGDFANSMGL